MDAAETHIHGITIIAYRAQCLQWQCKIACTWFFLLHLVSNDVKLHTSYFFASFVV
jgi:hypothetical protein